MCGGDGCICFARVPKCKGTRICKVSRTVELEVCSSTRRGVCVCICVYVYVCECLVRFYETVNG